MNVRIISLLGKNILNIFKLPYEYTQCTICYDGKKEKEKVDYCQTQDERFFSLTECIYWENVGHSILK